MKAAEDIAALLAHVPLLFSDRMEKALLLEPFLREVMAFTGRREVSSGDRDLYPTLIPLIPPQVAPFSAMSSCLSTPDRDPAEVYEKERREMGQRSNTELLNVRVTGTEYKKELAQEELQHREDARDVQIMKWTIVVSIVAIIASSNLAR